MSDQTQHSSGSASKALAFILGAVVVVVAVLGYLVYTGDELFNDPDVSIQLPGGTTLEGDVENAGN